MTATTLSGHMRSFRAMGTAVTLRLVDGGEGGTAALDRAAAVFAEVEAACTRFDPDSPLMRANAAPDRWHPAPQPLADAIEEAARAHRMTQGVFDPRVLDALTSLGYDRSLDFPRTGRPLEFDRERAARLPAEAAPVADRPWRPRVERHGSSARIHLDGARVDLGGIGKGLAVRWAADALCGAARGALVEAGGDCALLGAGPDGPTWLVGVEDPHGGADPVVVLGVTDCGCATSSVRVRRWVVGGRPVHHIVDPRTGLSADTGLAAVTVVHADPAEAEVWSKTLLLEGVDRVAERAAAEELPALWVEATGTVRVSAAAHELVVWRSDRVVP